MTDEVLREYILANKKVEIEDLDNKEQKILYESCPCCKGIGVIYGLRKGKGLKIWCTYRGKIYEEKRYYDR